jgi:hypothetical protein
MHQHDGCISLLLVSGVEAARLSPAVIEIFHMWTLLECVYPLNKARIKYVSIFLDENLTSQVKIVISYRTMVLNRIEWFILVTFKDHMPQGVLLKLYDLRHILDLYCGPYIRITSDDKVLS